MNKYKHHVNVPLIIQPHISSILSSICVSVTNVVVSKIGGLNMTDYCPQCKHALKLIPWSQVEKYEEGNTHYCKHCGQYFMIIWGRGDAE